MDYLQSTVERISRWSVYFCGALLLGCVGLITFEVVGRKLFNHSLLAVEELSGYALAISVAWGISYTLLQKGHIRIDALYVHLPAPLRRILDVAALLALALVFGTLVWHASGVLHESLRLGAKASTPLATPLWIPQSLWLAGLGFFSLCVFMLLARAAQLILRGDFAGLEREIGAHNTEQEVEFELAAERERSQASNISGDR